MTTYTLISQQAGKWLYDTTDDVGGYRCGEAAVVFGSCADTGSYYAGASTSQSAEECTRKEADYLSGYSDPCTPTGGDTGGSSDW